MSKERCYRRSKDGIHWFPITFLRMKQDAWTFHPADLAVQLIYQVRGGIDMPFGNGYIYGRIPSQEQEATK